LKVIFPKKEENEKKKRGALTRAKNLGD